MDIEIHIECVKKRSVRKLYNLELLMLEKEKWMGKEE